MPPIDTNSIMSQQQLNQSFQLPAEIRVMIYQYIAIQQSEDQELLTNLFENRSQQLHSRSPRHALPARIDLRNFQIPAFAQVSHQTRHEFLPEFFAAGRFTITVGPWSTPHRHQAGSSNEVNRVLDLFRARREAFDSPDPIFLTRRVALFLEKYREEAVFRNVQFSLHSGHDGAASWLMPLSIQIVAVTLVWQNRRLDVEISDDNEIERERESLIVRPAVDLARILTTRDGFRGFTVGDLRRIASSLRTGVGIVIPAKQSDSD